MVECILSMGAGIILAMIDLGAYSISYIFLCMKIKSLSFKPTLLITLLILGGLVFVYLAVVLKLLHENDLRNRKIIQARTSWVEENLDQLSFIYSTVFPLAEKCQQEASQSPVEMDCRQAARKLIDENLAQVLTAKSRFGADRAPVFFVKLKDQTTLEKLYQSGDFFEDKVDTLGEKMVTEMLQGQRDPFAYPQYNCCGGDDIIPELPLVALFLPPRVYLHDFPTEIEHIFLIREQGQIVGGLVYLYGD